MITLGTRNWRRYTDLTRPAMAHFRFLDLPTELRLQIFELCLLHHKNRIPIAFIGAASTSGISYNIYNNGSAVQQPAISCVSRQLRQETLPLFYASCFGYMHWCGHNVALHVPAWLRSVGDDKVAHLTSFSFSCGGEAVRRSMQKGDCFIQVTIRPRNGTAHAEIYARRNYQLGYVKNEELTSKIQSLMTDIGLRERRATVADLIKIVDHILDPDA